MKNANDFHLSVTENVEKNILDVLHIIMYYLYKCIFLYFPFKKYVFYFKLLQMHISTSHFKGIDELY